MHKIVTYISLSLSVIAIVFVISLPVLIFLHKKGVNLIRQLCWLGLLCSLVLIVFATLFYSGFHWGSEVRILNLKPFIWIEKWYYFSVYAERIGNVLMFIPLGFFLPAAINRTRHIQVSLFLFFLLTLFVEIIQYFIGRSCDIDDIIANVLGGFLGYLIYHLATVAFQKWSTWKQFIGKKG